MADFADTNPFTITIASGVVPIEEMHIKQGVSFVKVKPWIKQGSNWVEVDAYVKVGTQWVPVYEASV